VKKIHRDATVLNVAAPDDLAALEEVDGLLASA
jgi:hypothetical protein